MRVLFLQLFEIDYEAIHQRSCGQKGCQKGVHQEKQEGFVVEQTNTVEDPYAIVVHLEDTRATHGVMVRSGWFPGLH